MTNVGLAVLVFFISVLLGIKSNIDIHYKTIAFLGILSLVISISIGFYKRIRYEIDKSKSILLDTLFSLRSFLFKIDDKFYNKYGEKPSQEERKSFEENFKILEKFRDKLLKKGDIGYSPFFQFFLLAYGILNTVSYLIRYIFL